MMKFRFLFALVLVCGLCSAAKADPLDFNARVQDPPPPPAGLTTYDLTSNTFDVTFGGCPAYITDATGCFLAINDTGSTMTSLDLTFLNSTDPADPGNTTQYLNGQPVGCTTTEGGSLFSTAACSLSTDKLTYQLDFSGGSGIADAEFFIIAEDGPDPSAFGTGSAVATLAPVPEPNSGVLLGTGAMFVGMFLIGRKRDFFSV